MRKTLSRVLIIGILILTPSLISYANGPGTTAANFLKIGIGARATAMGEAFTALSNDGTSLLESGWTHSNGKKRAFRHLQSLVSTDKTGLSKFWLPFTGRNSRIRG